MVLLMFKKIKNFFKPKSELEQYLQSKKIADIVQLEMYLKEYEAKVNRLGNLFIYK